MYGGRLARWDLLRCVSGLATYLTQWTRREDAKLLRMMQYFNCSKDVRQVGFIGDPPEKLKLALYAESDFAGDRRDSKNTSGVFLAQEFWEDLSLIHI